MVSRLVKRSRAPKLIGPVGIFKTNVGGEPIEPDPRRRGRLDTAKVAPSAQQRLVHRIVGSMGAAEHQPAVPLEPSSVVLDELPEGALVTEPRRGEQAAVLIDPNGVSVDRHTQSNDRRSLNSSRSPPER
jgi:hypothetical protein